MQIKVFIKITKLESKIHLFEDLIHFALISF